MEKEKTDRFTDRAELALSLAREIACKVNSEVGPEHVLIGLIRERTGLGGNILACLGVTEQSLQASLGLGQVQAGSFEDFKAQAKTEASVLGHTYIGTEHLLLALLKNSRTVNILHGLGLSQENVKEHVFAYLSGRPVVPQSDKCVPQSDKWVIQRATDLASKAHRGVNRKYTGDPYILHPMRVALKTANWLPGNSIAVAAAVLHDVIEDTKWTETDIRNQVGYQVSELVAELTNPSKGHPELSRAERKKMDREHLAKVSLTAKVIKAIDRIDNLNEMTGADDGFKQKYADESQALLDEALRSYLMPSFFLLVSDFEFAIKSLRETIKGAANADQANIAE